MLSGLTCALLRMNMGLRGMFAGGVIGCGIGYVDMVFIVTSIASASYLFSDYSIVHRTGNHTSQVTS